MDSFAADFSASVNKNGVDKNTPHNVAQEPRIAIKKTLII